MKGALVLWLFLWALPATGQPHIALRGEDSFRFGTLYQGAVLSHEVALLNEGTDTLVIEQVDTPCHCTTTSLGSRRIAPHDSATLTITFDSRDFIDSVSKFVIVVSNDLSRRNLFIRFSAHIISLLGIAPRTLIFGEIPVGERVRGTVELINRGSDTLHLGQIISPEYGLEADFRPVSLAPGETRRLTLTFSPSQEKFYGETVAVELNRSDQPHAYFWVSARGVSR